MGLAFKKKDLITGYTTRKTPGADLIIAFVLQVISKLEGHLKRISGLAFSNALNVLISSGVDAQV